MLNVVYLYGPWLWVEVGIGCLQYRSCAHSQKAIMSDTTDVL